MRARYVTLILVGGLSLLGLIPSTGLPQYQGGGNSPGGNQGGYGGYGRGGGGGPGGSSRGYASMDPGDFYDKVLGGGPSVPLNDPRFGPFREPLSEWIKNNNLAGTSITKEQFILFGKSPEAENFRNRTQSGMGRGTGSQGGSGSGAPGTGSSTQGPVVIVGGQTPTTGTPGSPGQFQGSRNDAGGFDSRERYEFTRRDQNGDGVLSYVEMSDTLKGERDQWDTNRDGVIDQNEYSAYFHAFMERQNNMFQGQQGFGQNNLSQLLGGMNQNLNQGSAGTTATDHSRPNGPDNPLRDPINLHEYRTQVGTILYVEITGSTNINGIWGTDIYTDDSRLTRSAVHAGLVKAGEKKVVKVTILGPQKSFTGSVRNGVTSADFAAFEGSYKLENVTDPTVVYRAGKLPDNVPAWFKDMDSDQDGQVALYEWKAKNLPVDEFTNLDRNGDGFITFQEAVWWVNRPRPSGSTLVGNDPSKSGRGAGNSGRGNGSDSQGSGSKPFGLNPGGSQGNDPKTQGKQGNSQGNKDNKSMADQWSAPLSKTKDTITLSEIPGWMDGDKMREWAKKKGITTGTLTREQYKEYTEEQRNATGGNGPRR